MDFLILTQGGSDSSHVLNLSHLLRPYSEKCFTAFKKTSQTSLSMESGTGMFSAMKIYIKSQRFWDQPGSPSFLLCDPPKQFHLWS